MSPQIPPPTSSVSVPSEDRDPAAPPDPPGPGPSWWPRLRRIIGSLLIVGWLYGLVVWNLPESDRRDELRAQIEPVVNAAAMRQGWGVFSPNPTRTTHVTYARVTFIDGHEERFDAPHPGPWVGSTRSERWRKWETRVFRDTHTSLRLPAARWVADRFGGPDEVAEVELVHLRSPSPDPRTDEPRVWEADVFFRYDVQADRGRSVDEDPVEVPGP